MFCPRCSQEQVNEEIRYCSRCGFPLGLVAQLLANGGGLPQLEKQKSRFTRSCGWKFGLAWFFVLTILVAPFLAILGADGIPEISAALGIVGGLLIILISFIFLKNPSPALNEGQSAQSHKTTDALRETTSPSILPPQQSVPVSAYVPPENSWKAPETSDLAQPGSVTEGTTKLLEKDK